MVDDSKREAVGLFVAEDLEDHLLVEDGIQIVADGLGSVRLFAQRGDDERVHVEAGLGQVGLGRQIGDVGDLEEDEADDIAAAIDELVRVLSLLALQTPDPQPPPPLLGRLGLGRVLVLGSLVLVGVIIVLIVVVVGPPPAEGRRGGGRLALSGGRGEDGRAGRGGVPRRIGAGGGLDESGELLEDLGVGGLGVGGIEEGELQQHLA